MEMIFRIGIAILQYCKEDLLQHDMEGMLRVNTLKIQNICIVSFKISIHIFILGIKHSTKVLCVKELLMLFIFSFFMKMYLVDC